MVEKILEEREDGRQDVGRGDGISRDVASTGEPLCSVQARQEEARRRRRRKNRSGSSLVSSCFQELFNCLDCFKIISN
ncbi:hypothetical protein PV326_009957 [Microctonus aethiopoides]|nr:hypothetical protein PV326_009957 [Microctonus aethiopoides]